MKFEVITLFPDYFHQPLRQSLVGKALEKKLFDIDIINLRDFALDKHRTVDAPPFGGGGGMVMKVEPLDRCLASLGYPRGDADRSAERKERIILTSAAGEKFTQKKAIAYSLCSRVTIICGHYLGVDERILDLYPIDEISIGDFVLSGGEPAALVIVDAVARLQPGVLGNFESALEDSHMEQIVGAPCYTKPADYEGLKVPDVLLSGNHREIKAYRRRAAIEKCVRNRPDLLRNADLTDEEKEYIKQIDPTFESD